MQTVPGVTCWQKAVAIEKVGLYIPGGTAPLFSTVDVYKRQGRGYSKRLSGVSFCAVGSFGISVQHETPFLLC